MHSVGHRAPRTVARQQEVPLAVPSALRGHLERPSQHLLSPACILGRARRHSSGVRANVQSTLIERLR
jgi:hypothetical protein